MDKSNKESKTEKKPKALVYDTIVVGGGPAAMSAALTAARSNLSVLVIAKEIGGHVTETFSIENYPGFTKISGKELADKMLAQIKANDVKVIEARVESIRRLKKGFKLKTDKKSEHAREYSAKTIIMTTGSNRRLLGIPGEKRLSKKGVSYCSTSGVAKTKGEIVGVVGGSDSAASSAIFLSDSAKKVYIFFRGDGFYCEPKRREFIRKSDKINLVPNTNIVKIKGKSKVESVICDDGREIRLDHVFVVVGSSPAIRLAKMQKMKCDRAGFIKVDAAQQTSVPGIFAAGDITTNSNYYRQIVTAVAEGAIAANSVFRFLR